MDVNEWVSYECSDEGVHTQNIRNPSTRSHASEEENRTRNRSKNRKCKGPYRPNAIRQRDANFQFLKTNKTVNG